MLCRRQTSRKVCILKLAIYIYLYRGVCYITLLIEFIIYVCIYLFRHSLVSGLHRESLLS